MADFPPEMVRALARATGVGPDRAAEILPLVYEELRGMAARYFRRERRDHTLQPTALVHEAYLKLMDQRKVEWKSRTHFLAVASQAMGRILIDHARRHHAGKRGGAFRRITLDGALVPGGEPDLDLLDLQKALEKLAALDPRAARVVEMRFFGGMSVEEVAEALEVSTRTVEGDWKMARAWLKHALQGSEP